MPEQSREELLKQYPNLKDFLPYLDGLNKESPRGRVLISTGYLEQMLEDILRAFMLDQPSVDDLFAGGSAPLSSFSARAKVCYTLGLISGDEYDDIDEIRRIRNKFAHEMHASFDDQSIKSRCDNLRHKAQDKDDMKFDALMQFTTAASGLLLNLVNRATYVAEQRRSYGNWKR